MNKVYLGDGAYAELCSQGVKLTTSDGLRDTNTIYLGPHALSALCDWFESVAERPQSTEGPR